MFLRIIAAIVLVLSVAGAWLGNSPGRQTVRDHSNCFLLGIFDYWIGDHPAHTTHHWFKGADFSITTEATHTCRPEYLEELRSAVDETVVAALIAVAIGAACAVLLPRRWMAKLWLGSAAIAAFLAFVVTRSWTVRPGETVWLWPRYATWGIVVAIAVAMAVVAGWLIAMPSSARPARARDPG